MSDTIQLKRGTKNLWDASSVVLKDGEFGFETDTFQLKVGNGVEEYNQLPYIFASLLIDNVFRGQNAFHVKVVDPSDSFAPDLSKNWQSFTSDQDFSIAAPTNLTAATQGYIDIKYGGNHSVLSVDAAFKYMGVGSPTFSNDPYKLDRIHWVYDGETLTYTLGTVTL